MPFRRIYTNTVTGLPATEDEYNKDPLHVTMDMELIGPPRQEEIEYEEPFIE